MAHVNVKIIMFLLAPGYIGSLSRHPLLMKIILLKELTMKLFVPLFLNECYKLRLTSPNVLEITDLS